MKRAVSFFVGLVLLFVLMNVVGCRDAEKEAELQAQINSAKSDLAQVQAANAAIMHVGDSLNTELKLVQAANDSLTEVNQKTAGRLASVQSDLKKERKDSDSLKLVVAKMEPAVRELPIVKQQLADEQTAHAAADADVVRLNGVVAERDSFIANQVTPWYLKWRHDATTRGFVKVMFGAGKAPIPAVPEPDLK